METSSPRRGYACALGLLLTLPAAKAVLADSIDPDFFWHVRVAEQLLRDGIGPVPDPFSFMSNAETWTPFSWLGELVMKWTYDAAGLRGVISVHALCSVAFFLFIALACGEATRALLGERRHVATLASVGFAMLLSLAFLSFRPVTFALVLIAGMTWLVWRDVRMRDRWTWAIVPGTLVLTNLHLYVILFVVGLGARTFGLWVDAWRVKSPRHPWRETTFVVACALAALATPMLPGCVRNAIWFNGHDPMVIHGLVAEITPFYAGPLGKILLVGVAATWIFAIRAWRTLGFANLMWLLAATFFLFQMGRFATVFAVVACPIAAVALPRIRDVVLARRPIQFATAAVALLVVGRIAVEFPRGSTTMDAWLTRTGDADSLRYPTAAAAFVERDVPRRTGRLLNELTWGGYLIWRLGDRYQVFMDGRTLIYPARFWEQLYVDGDDARLAFLRDQRADAAILPRTRSRLHASLTTLGWRKAYADERAIVLLPPAEATASGAE